MINSIVVFICDEEGLFISFERIYLKLGFLEFFSVLFLVLSDI